MPRDPSSYPDSAEAFAAIAQRFKVLSEPTRLRLLHALREGQRTVGELVEELECAQPRVSKHLGILRQAGMVERERLDGRLYYRISEGSVFELCDIVCEGITKDLDRRRDVF